MNSKSLGPAGAANPVAAAAAYGYSQQQQQQQQQYGFQPPSQQPAVAVPSRTGSIASAFVAMERPQVAFRMEGNKGSVAEGFAGEDGAPPAKQARLMPEPGAADDAAAAAGGAAVAAADGGGGAAGNGAADAAATAEAVAKPKGSLFVPPSEIDEQNPFADDPEGGPVSADPQPVYGGVEEHLKAQQQQQWDQYQQQQQQANQGAAQPRMYDPTKLKSKICRNIARSGYCAMGYYCTFVRLLFSVYQPLLPLSLSLSPISRLSFSLCCLFFLSLFLSFFPLCRLVTVVPDRHCLWLFFCVVPTCPCLLLPALC